MFFRKTRSVERRRRINASMQTIIMPMMDYKIFRRVNMVSWVHWCRAFFYVILFWRCSRLHFKPTLLSIWSEIPWGGWRIKARQRASWNLLQNSTGKLIDLWSKAQKVIKILLIRKLEFLLREKFEFNSILKFFRRQIFTLLPNSVILCSPLCGLKR